MEVPAADRQSVLQIFERHRASPGAVYDESHFLDYLIVDPKHVGAIRNSFQGLRRYNAFIQETQLQYSVCFSRADFNANYSVDAFGSRINKLQSSPRGSIASLRNQRRAGFGWHAVVLSNLLGLSLAAWLFSTVPAACYALVLLIVIADTLGVRAFVRWRSYSRLLMSQLTQLRGHDA
jgi:hypothetical protein